jgi:hypothetical protein
MKTHRTIARFERCYGISRDTNRGKESEKEIPSPEPCELTSASGIDIEAGMGYIKSQKHITKLTTQQKHPST